PHPACRPTRPTSRPSPPTFDGRRRRSPPAARPATLRPSTPTSATPRDHVRDRGRVVIERGVAAAPDDRATVHPVHRARRDREPHHLRKADLLTAAPRSPRGAVRGADTYYRPPARRQAGVSQWRRRDRNFEPKRIPRSARCAPTAAR